MSKKLITPLPSGGFPLENEDITTLQNEAHNVIAKLYGAIAPAFVVAGCDVTSVNPVQRTCSVGAGYVWLNNELRSTSNYTGTYPCYIVESTDVVTTKRFFNGANQSAYVEKTATFTTTQPAGSANSYITFNPYTQLRLIPIITGTVASDLQDERDARIDDMSNMSIALDTERLARLAGDQTLQSLITALTNVVNTKQARVTTRIPWTNIPLDASGDWTSTENTSDTNSAFYGPAQYMRTEDGIVHLRGYLRCNVQYTKTNSYGSTVIGLLPPGCRPQYRWSTEKGVPFHFYNNTGNNNPAFTQTTQSIVVQENGYLFVSTRFLLVNPANDATIGATLPDRTLFLDGISYSVEGGL